MLFRSGFVVVAGRSRTTMFDIHGVGAFTRTSWPVWMNLSRASLIVGSFGAAHSGVEQLGWT